MAQQRSDGGHKEAKVVNESSVEIGESKKTLKFFDRLRLGP